MKRFIFAISLSIVLAGCATIEESIHRYPPGGIESNAGVGQSIYRYEKTGEKLIDYTNGETHIMTDDVTYEILFSGYSQGTLRATYREFVNDMARPAFSQEATYDFVPGAPTKISFKGAQIEVLDANNNEIRYKVLRGFDGEDAVIVVSEDAAP